MRCSALQISFAILCTASASALPAAEVSARFGKVVFGVYSENLKAFEEFAKRAKRSGATHIVLTAEDLPWARWQYDTPRDPYPAWAITNHGLLKVAVPEALKPYIPQKYSDTIMQALGERCQVLGQLGLGGMYHTFEPQMLPEKVYEDHPLWRGPQVDSPPRSRVPRFAPAIESPEVLALYRESMKKLTTACPQLDTLSFYTNDSGTGMSWSEGLYPGANGSSLYAGRRMYDRYRDLFAALRAGAIEGGAKTLEIDVRWDRERNPELSALKLEAGTAIANFEGPKATPYKAEVGFLLDYLYAFDPARGIPVAVQFLNELERAFESKAPRLFVLIGDRFNKDLYFSIYDAFRAQPTNNYTTRIDLLRRIAAQRVGKENAELLLEAWLALGEVEQDASLLMQGGYVFSLGSVHQRWLTRPFVPFPEELTDAERQHYRPYLFQATTEERTANLHELQGTRVYSGMGGRVMTGKLLARMNSVTERARRTVRTIVERLGAKAHESDVLLDDRLRVFQSLIQNCRNAIEYQYYLDIVKAWNVKRPFELGSLKNVDEWMAIRRVARQELDNTAVLLKLLESGKPDLIHLAATKEETDIRMLEPNLAESLRKKMQIMMKHWEDHERLFWSYEIDPPNRERE
jgi:hypothetical protein